MIWRDPEDYEEGEYPQHEPSFGLKCGFMIAVTSVITIYLLAYFLA